MARKINSIVESDDNTGRKEVTPERHC